jgi:phosphatidylglycerol:prolipoprotein diacylglycerol transferase
MHPYIHIGFFQFPVFGLMILLGIGVGACVVLLNCKLHKAEMMDPYLASVMGLAGAMFGSKAIGPIMKIPEVIRNWDEIMSGSFISFMMWLFAETVFYGGLIGALLMAYLYCRIYKVSFLRVASLAAPAIPAGHAFGRIGCFLAGCCYGMEVPHSHPLGVIYPERTDGLVGAPAGVPLLAVPLIEAAFLLLISATIILIGLKIRKDGFSIGLYLCLYAVLRFILEYFRGDLIRGVYGLFSTSQYISMGMFFLGAVILIVCFRKPISIHN